ncbi:response regulator transcription factor [Desulforhopalus sp. IMCC35007]|uniref:response regulator transcription factor n=1 Tax=Desulforhopalus sp. IMCC35007 TaxID=2569543 RepID=UPI00145EC8F7|nr:response regulator transcription factor [Desulforhopalus sp. IMCC35007]
MNKVNILFLGDESKYYQDLRQVLTANGMEVTRVDSITKEDEILTSVSPHLVIVYSPQEGVGGLAFCQELRSFYSGLMVLVSCQKDTEFHTLALGLGADASLSAEQGTSFIAANIHAMLRRCEALNPTKKLTFGHLTIDSSKRDAYVGDEAASLSTIEFQLIWLLARRQGSVVSREDIHRELYKTGYNGYDRSIDLYISRIRQKIGDDPNSSRYVKTVRGLGYQFIPNKTTVSGP